VGGVGGVCVCEIGLHCPISDWGEIGAKKGDMRMRNARETHKTLSDLQKNEKQLQKRLGCPISKTVGKIARTHLSSGGNSHAGRLYAGAHRSGQT